MTAGAGVDRDAERLEKALVAIDSGGSDSTADMALVARAVVTAALTRTESRGCHRRSDTAAPGDAGATIALRLDGDGGGFRVSSVAPRGLGGRHRLRPTAPRSAVSTARSAVRSGCGRVDPRDEVGDGVTEGVVVVAGSGVSRRVEFGDLGVGDAITEFRQHLVGDDVGQHPAQPA